MGSPRRTRASRRSSPGCSPARPQLTEQMADEVVADLSTTARGCRGPARSRTPGRSAVASSSPRRLTDAQSARARCGLHGGVRGRGRRALQSECRRASVPGRARAGRAAGGDRAALHRRGAHLVDRLRGGRHRRRRHVDVRARARCRSRAPTVWGGDWSRDHFGRALEHEGHLNDLASAVLSELPERFTAAELEYALLGASRPALHASRQPRADAGAARHGGSAYRADFAPDTPLSARVLLPVAAEENHGMEDARFVRFTDDDGVVEYRATYTAYDGRDIAPRLITSPDLTRVRHPPADRHAAPATRAWRSSPASSAATIWRSAAPTARTSRSPARATA